jgi:RNA-binding protein
MSKPFTNPQIKKLKALAQRLDPVLHVGKEGVGERFLKSAGEELDRHELIKIKFVALKEEKRTLAPLVAEKTASYLVSQVGNVFVLYRANTDPAQRKIVLPD